jgi:hypothetical protein
MVAVSLDHPQAEPMQILSDCGQRPVISPNERYIADCSSHELRIVDAVSKQVVATWAVPPVPRRGLHVSWSPDSRELAITGLNGNWMGLWIYDLATHKAVEVLDGPWMFSRWTPDKTKMALTLGVAIEIWEVDLDPDRPTAASFQMARTMEQHRKDLMLLLDDWVLADPAFLQAHYQRTCCALWMDHPQAAECLRRFEQVLPPYNAADCAAEARWMVDAEPELRDKLLPLALLLARKAVEKDPENVEYRKVLETALQIQQ